MMAQITVTGAAEPCSTISASLMWTPSDTLPGAIASAQPDIQFLTLADALPEPVTLAAPHPRRRRAMPQAFAEAYAASICHRLALTLTHATALRVALREGSR